MTFEDCFCFKLGGDFRIEVYWDVTSRPIFSGLSSNFPKEILEKIKTRKIAKTILTEEVAVIRISETFEDLLDTYPELLEFNVEIYLGKVLAFANNLSKISSESLQNLKQRSVIEFDFTEDLKKAIITLEDYTKVEEREYPLLKDELPKLRKHHLGWTVIILNQDDDEYNRFTLSSELTEYETNPELCDILSEQIETEDNWNDVAEIYIATNISVV